jgi:hypothetical protein
MTAITHISKSHQFEFNDSVLDTKGWKSSRYDGRQLSSKEVNKYNNTDTTYAHTPVVSNYSRNIYIGSRVIGMPEPISGSQQFTDDPTLTPFPGFSYITVDEYITVNSDDTIIRRSVRGGRGEDDDLNAKKGFYQSWYKDFPIGGKTSIRPLDKKLAQSLAPRYDIFNNSGQLQKMLLVTQEPVRDTYDSGSKYALTYHTASNIFNYASGSGNSNALLSPSDNDMAAEYSIFNYLLLQAKFFSGSLIFGGTGTPGIAGGGGGGEVA